jgi:hypothetical protein
MPRNRDRIKQALERAAEKGRPLTKREIEEFYRAEPSPKPITGSPLERKIQRRVVSAPAVR